jgi:sterol desaturase/sphingolipid hydroxylase (fatty acid hydroxylase superfamily)
MEYETAIRLISFVLIFILIAIWEILMPRRTLTTSKKLRWFNNLSIVAISPVLLHLVFPVLAVGVAQTAQANGWGLLNFNYLGISSLIALGVGFVALDLVIYLQHVMFHAVPLLWRLHMVHHADLDFDLTTGLRFHPVEIVLSMLVKMMVIIALGPPVEAVLAFEILLNGMAIFNHGNIRISTTLDKWLRWFVVTPDMHRVHHSVIIRETNSNYGFNLSVWDRLFGTYWSQPQKGHTAMVIGLSQFRDQKKLTLPWLLILPIIGDPGKQPINRH